MERTQVEFEALVDRAIPKFEPAKRIWPTSVRLALWLGLEAVVLGLVALSDPRPDLLSQLGDFPYIAPLVVFTVAGTVAAALALRAAVPGREPMRSELFLLSLLIPIAVAAVFLAPTVPEPFWQFIRAGTWCLGCTLALGAVPWMVLLWAVNRGAPFMFGTEGALIGTAAFSFAFVASRLGCPIDDQWHILVWHVLPVFAATWISIGVGAAWLRREKTA
jgi:hypothetical protein